MWPKMMDNNTSLLTKNTAFEHKFHFDRRKWPKKQNGNQITIIFERKKRLFGQKQLDENGRNKRNLKFCEHNITAHVNEQKFEE
jgi:hypothetical protein